MDFRCRTEPPSQHVCMDFPCWANRPCGGTSAWISAAGLNRPCGGMSAWISCRRTAVAHVAWISVLGEPPCGGMSAWTSTAGLNRRRSMSAWISCAGRTARRGMSAWISRAERTACAAARPHGFSAPDCRRNVFYSLVSVLRAVFRSRFFNSAFLGFIGSGKDRPFPARDLGLRPELASQRPVFRLFPNACEGLPAAEPVAAKDLRLDIPSRRRYNVDRRLLQAAGQRCRMERFSQAGARGEALKGGKA